MFWIYDIPNGLFALLAVASAVALSTLGLVASRPLIARILGHGSAPDAASIEAHNGAVNTYLSVVGLFYGLTLGLISVSVWQSYADVEARTTSEAATMGALYRSFGSYPSPEGPRLQETLRAYTLYTMRDAWPQFRRGQVPAGISGRMSRLARQVYAFEPRTEAQKALHAETLSELHELTELIRLRLLSVTSGLPPTLWMVVLCGGALTIATTYLFVLPSLRLHILLTGLAAAMIGLMLFLMAAMDYPFRGSFSVGPDAFELTYSQLMQAP